jgi:cyclopropane fatty-acyl-phospholipid synthase-like methyltransferase
MRRVARPDDRRFADLTFDDFRRLATDATLSPYEKIGFPDEYRDGYEPAIFADIEAKLPPLGERRDQVVLDIGPGCSELPAMVRARCEANGHTLVLVDSEEMLAHHADGERVRKFSGRFPDCPGLLEEFEGRVDAIVAYSVLHYVFPNASVHAFLDEAMKLLAHGGHMLIGDIPNVSKRRRFFSSPAGREFHREFTGSDAPPEVTFNSVEPDKIDDAVLLGLVARARAAGYEAHLVPQGDALPMANRREDLLVVRP